jgi:Holliday junction resolvase RusA-like endonuclease
MAWNRARIDAVGKSKPLVFKSRKQVVIASTIATYASLAMRGRQPFKGPVELSVLCIYQWPKTWSKERRRIPGAAMKTSVPDGDNLMKAIMDGANGILWTDDAVIADWRGRKEYGDEDATYVTVRAYYEEG